MHVEHLSMTTAPTATPSLLLTNLLVQLVQRRTPKDEGAASYGDTGLTSPQPAHQHLRRRPSKAVRAVVAGDHPATAHFPTAVCCCPRCCRSAPESTQVERKAILMGNGETFFYIDVERL